MADQKKSLTTADDQKASSITPDASLVPAGETKKKIRKAPKVKKKNTNKKGIPIVLDILIVILLLAAIGGAAFGIYAAGKYYSTRYTETEITYTLLLRDVDVSIALDDRGKSIIPLNSTVYLADEQGGYVLGKVMSTGVQRSEEDENAPVDVYVVVRTNANYNHTLGYFVEQTKIAVGKSYVCRFEGLMSEAVIVGLQVQE
ncbi:MAG: hypothetical protein E7594_00430 [Ruminococcaceae bacterium]|nr:hypothetical protein [Oscillospiraceae bacterium]